jgi:hypothetical protein
LDGPQPDTVPAGHACHSQTCSSMAASAAPEYG